MSAKIIQEPEFNVSSLREEAGMENNPLVGAIITGRTFQRLTGRLKDKIYPYTTVQRAKGGTARLYKFQVGDAVVDVITTKDYRNEEDQYPNTWCYIKRTDAPKFVEEGANDTVVDL